MIGLTGLVSVTFRNLEPLEIINLVARAGLQSIEWGGDIHVPHGDIKRANQVRQQSNDHGLKVAAYGSYFRVFNEPGEREEFAPVLDAALALGAPTIRVWAGRFGSLDVSSDALDRLAAALRDAATLAGDAGIHLALEFHGGTFTDTTDSTLRLLKKVEHQNLFTLWQPPVGMDAADCSLSLSAVLPWLAHVHVFHWEPTTERRALAGGASRWSKYLDAIASAERSHDLLLEFVEDNSTDRFMADAATLLGWIQRLRSS